jgi:predicted acyl esterase
MKILRRLRIALCAGLLISFAVAGAQETTPQKGASKEYTRSEAMVPMRDGVKLHVVILRPAGSESGESRCLS